MNLICPAAIVPQIADTHPNIDFCHAERLAIVQGLNRGQNLRITLKQIRQLDEVFPALFGGDLFPGTFKGVAGDLDRNVNIFVGGFADCNDGFFRGGVDGFEFLAVFSLDKLIVDEAGYMSVRSFGMVGQDEVPRMPPSERKGPRIDAIVHRVSPSGRSENYNEECGTSSIGKTYSPYGCLYLRPVGRVISSISDILEAWYDISGFRCAQQRYVTR